MRSKISELCRRGNLESTSLTKFKYLLSRTTPASQLNRKLIEILKRYPHLSTNICSYFGRYSKLPKRASEELLSFIVNEDIFHAVQADVLFATLDIMNEPYKSLCLGFCYKRLFKNTGDVVATQCTLKAALIAWVLKNNNITYAEMHDLLIEEIDWWITKNSLKYLEINQYGKASYQAFLHEAIKSRSSDVSRIAALKIIEDGLDIGSAVDAHEAARLLFFSAGKIRHIGKIESLIGKVICQVIGIQLPSFDWARVLGDKHKNGEMIAFTIKKDYESNINACLIALDSFCDLLFECLFKRILPDRTYGKYGSMLQNPTMQENLPKTCLAFNLLHQLRLQSLTAHPRDKAGQPTRRLKHRDLYTIRPSLQAAFLELIAASNQST
ncbi:MAG: hypothetical protein M0Z52_06660 [Actinomycetota bacterium]|nr:hypothetical protein [Actinomycetota bacterium]